jgi:hypothetical protein
MNEPQPISPRRRLQELLAIPDNQRSEAEWDELNELEIKLAPGNRADAPNQRSDGPPQGQGQRRNGPQPPRHANPGANPNNPNAGTQGKKPFKKFHKKPPKPATP